MELPEFPNKTIYFLILAFIYDKINNILGDVE